MGPLVFKTSVPVKSLQAGSIPGATHIDLYDKAEYVPQVVTKLNDFYSKYL